MGHALGAVLLGTAVATAGTAAFWTPYAPAAINLRARLQAPSAAHWFGTDEFGRDVLSRAMAGSLLSASVAAGAVLIALGLGATIGLLTGYLRGRTDRVIMAANDALLAFPGILLALAVLAILGPSLVSTVVALGISYTPAMARVVRGTVLSVRLREFVEASLVCGNGGIYTMLRHVLPNAVAPIIVLATGMLGWALLAESSLSFLGLGVPPPAPSWGNMLAASRPYMGTAAWLELVPGVCIALTLLAVNLVGDALRDALDPRGRAM